MSSSLRPFRHWPTTKLDKAIQMVAESSVIVSIIWMTTINCGTTELKKLCTVSWSTPDVSRFVFNDLHNGVAIESFAGWKFLSAAAPHPQILSQPLTCRNLRNLVRYRPAPADVLPALAPQALLTGTSPALFSSQTCACHGIPLKTHGTCLIASGKLISGSFQNQRKFWKTLSGEKVKPS